MPGQARAGHRLQHLGDERVALRFEGGDRMRLALGLREFERDGEPHGTGHVLGARAAVALLSSPVDERLNRGVRRQQQRSDPLRGAELVARDRDGVGRREFGVAGTVEREPASELHRIGVQQRSDRVRRSAQGAQRLQRAHLVVRGLHAHQRRAGSEGGDRGIGIHHPVSIDRDARHVDVVPALEVRGRLEHRLVLDRADENVSVTTASQSGQREADDREVVALGAAAGEHDLRRAHASEAGDARAGIRQCVSGSTAQ